MDECGTKRKTANQNTLALRGDKNSHFVTNGMSAHITTVVTGNAKGDFLPRTYIFKRSKVPRGWDKHLPNKSTKGLATASGGTEKEIWPDILSHIMEHMEQHRIYLDHEVN